MLGFPYALGDRITKAFPPAVMGKDIPLAGIFDETHPRYGEAGEIRALYEAEAEVRQVIDTARGLEGLIRQAGVHAAGVIMSSEPIVDHVPVWKREADGAVITQFDYPACESLGLLKMDFLGLRNLTVLDDAVRGVQGQPGHRGRPGDPAAGRQAHLRAAGPGRHAGHLPVRRRPDAGAAAQHAAGQLRGHLRGRRAVPARPDGRQRAQRVRRPEEPAQAGRADPSRAGRAAGRNPGRHLRADRLPGAGHGHRAEGGRVQPGQRGPAPPGHGQEEEGDPGQGVRAVRGRDEGATATPTPAIKTLWDILVPFSDYAFNKAHTAAYGLVSYWTAYLKANYPAEYMAALLTSVSGDKDKSALYLNECRRMGITVLPPDVNASDGHVHPGRQRHPVRPGRDPQRRHERGGRDRRGADGQGRVHQLRRLPAQGPGQRVQQAGHRVAGQGGRVRLARAPAQGPGAHPRAGHRHRHRRQAQRGDRPGLAVRRGRRDRGHVRGPGAGRGVGQDHPAGVRARDARPVRVRPPAAGRGAHRGRGHRLLRGRAAQLRRG